MGHRVSLHVCKMQQTEKEVEEKLTLGYIQVLVAQLPFSHSGVKGHIIGSSSSSVFALTLELQIRAFAKTVQFYRIYKDSLF